MAKSGGDALFNWWHVAVTTRMHVIVTRRVPGMNVVDPTMFHVIFSMMLPFF